MEKPPPDDESGEAEPLDAGWQQLERRCCYSLEPLIDPARCSRCKHPPRCNFDSLLACVRTQSRACPVAGCAVKSMRSREVARDDALRTAPQVAPRVAHANPPGQLL